MTDCEDDDDRLSSFLSPFLPFSARHASHHIAGFLSWRSHVCSQDSTRQSRSDGRSVESLTRNAQRCVAHQFLGVSVAFLIMIMIMIIIILFPRKRREEETRRDEVHSTILVFENILVFNLKKIRKIYTRAWWRVREWSTSLTPHRLHKLNIEK